MEEHKESWAGLEQVLLDCVVMSFVQRRNKFVQRQAVQATADVWENNGGDGVYGDSFKSAHSITPAGISLDQVVLRFCIHYRDRLISFHNGINRLIVK